MLCSAGLILTAVSCREDGEVTTEGVNKIILNTNKDELSKRINLDNSGVLKLKGGKDGKTAGLVNIPLLLVAEVSSPVYEGNTLRATHVSIQGNYAYVSYNTEGEKYLGAIEVIDLTDPNNPVLVTQAIFPGTDISSVYFDGGKLYISGASDIYTTGATTPAFAGVMTLANNLLSTNYVQTELKGMVGHEVVAANDKYYAVSGASGALTKINKANNQVEITVDLADLRSIGYNNNRVVVLSGNDGIKVYDNNLALVKSFPTESNVLDSKRTIDFMGTNVLVSEGAKGFGVYNLSTGSKVQTVELPNITTGDASDRVTNAVSVNNGYVFAANGGIGLSVYQNNGTSLSLAGTIDLPGSCNFVMSRGEYIFAAMGKSGFKIIKTVWPATGPDCSTFTPYNGNGGWLNVNSGENFKYSGTKSFQGVNVNHILSWCGNLTVLEGLNVNSNATFNMYGELYQGNKNNVWNSLNINTGSVLNVEGKLTTYGNMIFNSGATLKMKGDIIINGDVTFNNNTKIEFIGSNNKITIVGKVTKNAVPTITGSYVDVNNKL